MYNPSRAFQFFQIQKGVRKQLCYIAPYTCFHGLYTFFYIHVHCIHIQFNGRAVFRAP